jgi:excinuclease ABC subunit A
MRKVLDLDPKSFIIIKGAQLHNLKNIDVAIPRNKMTVITGLSGSGKSSLAFDTLYAEGQRRYVESLSSYARQFMGRLNKPKVDKIIGISPAIAVEQKVNISNPRSTVGTKTEIYEYLKLLYSRIGVTYSPISGRVVKKDIVRDFLNQQGFARILVDNKIERIEPNKLPKAQFELVVDRVVINDSEEFYQRFADAVQIAFYEGNGKCSLKDLDLDKTVTFSNNFELDGIDFLNPNIHLFSFNNPYGACEKCEGYGDLVGINPELVIPDTSRSIYEEAISPWRSTGYRKFYSKLIESAINFDFPIHKPYFELTKAEKDILWNGNKFFTGIMSFFKKIEKKNYKIQNRVLLSRFRGKTKCSDCKGSRLRNETNYVKVGGKSLPELIDLPIKELSIFFQKLNISKTEEKISSRILIEINSRVSVLNDLGLDYLTLNRKSNSLSGGESQRINIAVSLGSSLVGSMYILDEPSIGLHSRDNERLIKILKRLRDIGNTVIIIEHDEEIMTAADEIIDMGPEAGSFGGEIVATGSFKEILKSNTLTSKYLSGEMKIEVPKKRRKSNNWISVCGARENNLKNITAKFQIGGLTVVSGVSGSGKSTLVKDILYPALLRNFDIYTLKPGQFSSLDGDLNMIKSVEFINQNPIGRSSRSNPVTYIKAYDEIRALFANQNLSKNRNYKPKHFSFNVDGGRCDTCKGEGVVSIEMQFMADVILECDTCKGKRFKSEVREIKYNNYSIDQVLDLTIDEALNLFEFNGEKKLVRKLKPLNDVGLGYVTLGQSSTTLSGGEAQRIKLASFIAKGATKDKVLFIFDEPTTGLHFHDITKLLKSFDALLDNGHSLVVVEHNLELIKCADHMIELGPMAGKEGGQIVAQGTPEDVADVKNAPSSKYLKKKLSV